MSQISRLEALKEHNSQVKNDSLVYKRIKTLFDEGTFTELNSLAKFEEKQVGVVTGYGMVNGATVFAFCQDSDVDGGAVSVAGCAKIKKVYEMAAKVGVPVVGIYDSVGARLCEGADMLGRCPFSVFIFAYRVRIFHPIKRKSLSFSENCMPLMQKSRKRAFV